MLQIETLSGLTRGGFAQIARHAALAEDVFADLQGGDLESFGSLVRRFQDMAEAYADSFLTLAHCFPVRSILFGDGRVNWR